ncbi:MAG: methyl-accepting chemotaxis protein [Candidatus Thiodiazotropha sp. (ex Cardiolucina cf. quadrata)]|nr:methyl-accepting chemotaxis protein [Candidatus Thiodiazotropha sp. (ex Cardiolucina cf. quadrata)]
MSVSSWYVATVSLFFERFKIRTLVFMGMAFFIALMLFTTLFALYQLGHTMDDLSKAAGQAADIRTVVKEVEQGSKLASSSASKLSEEMNQKLVKMLQTNVSDMGMIQSAFEKMVKNLNTLIESEEEDPTTLMLEIEDIYEQLRKESLPRVRSIVSEFEKAAVEGEREAKVTKELQSFAETFKEKSVKAAGASAVIEQDSALSVQRAEESMQLLLIIIVVSVIFVFITSFNTYLVINRPISLMRERIKDIAEGEGDLTKRLNEDASNEFGELSHWFNVFMDKLQSLVGNVKDSTGKMTNAASQMLEMTQQSSSGVLHQKTKTEEIVHAMQNLSVTVDGVADSAAEADQATESAEKESVKGSEDLRKTISSITSLAEEIDTAASIINGFQKDSEDIGGVLDVIKGIAEQTNLLALNAAIEAARAGEQGRGFAVVADEVRTLATRTQESTQEIQAIITRLQSGAEQAVNAMNTGRTRGHETAEQAKQAGVSLESITQAVDEISAINSKITDATGDQRKVASDVNEGINTISQVSEQTATRAEQTSQQGKVVSQLAHELHDSVKQFKV